MQTLWTGEQARQIDALSVAANTAAAAQLMERAGAAVAEVVLQHSSPRDRIVVLVGKGNNGGDALVAARLLQVMRSQVIVVHVAQGWDEALLGTSGRTVVVDGIYGLGFLGPHRDPAVEACIAAVNGRQDTVVIAIDLPSGLSADSARKESDCAVLKADVCVTFGALKPVHCLVPEYCGKVVVADVGFAASAVDEVLAHTQKWQYADQPLPSLKRLWNAALSPAAHKFARGHVLVIGGSQGKLGAPLWSAGAAAAGGAGWVSVALPDTTGGYRFLPLQYTYEHLFARSKVSAPQLAAFLRARKLTAIVIGPGMLKGAGFDQVIDRELWGVLSAFTHQGGHLVIDAGACSGLLDVAESAPAAPGKALATPHPGEWLGLSHATPVSDIHSAADSIAVLERARRCGVSLCYKGASPILFSALNNEPVTICAGHDPRLAKAGTGDLLAGLCAAMVTPCGSVESAFVAGYTHLRFVAGRLSLNRSDYSFTAADFLEGLRRPL